MATDPILVLRNVMAAYGRVPILHDISLSLGHSQSLAILGINGAGKTTLMRALTGLLVRRSGQISFDGAEIQNLAAHAIVHRGISMVPEGRHLFAPLSVLENLTIGALPLRVARRDAEADQALDLVFDLFPRLAERRTQLAGTLSGGEQQMLAIGRALMAKPKLLILDEPSIGLAPKVIEDLFIVLRRLKDMGLGIVIAEQHVPLALDLADEVALLRLGRIVLTGKPSELRDRSEIQRAYFGSA